MQRMRNLLLFTALAALTIGYAQADTLSFDLSPTNGLTSRGPGDGPGQGVTAGSNTTITSMAMFLDMPNGGDIKYMIWGNGNSTLLFSQTMTVSASGTQSWVKSNPFSFTMAAGQEYWFGVIADNSIDVGYIFPTISYSANGLTADSSGNSNYTDFANPAFAGYAGAEIGLQLYTGSAPPPIPEPGSLLLFGSGVIALAGVARRKLNF